MSNEIYVTSPTTKVNIGISKDLSQYYSQEAKRYAQEAEQSAINSANSAVDSNLGAASAQEAVNSILNNEGFIAVSNDLNGENNIGTCAQNLELFENAGGYAQTAQVAAQVATEQANIATQKAQEAAEVSENKANIDLDNLSEAGLKVIQDASASGFSLFDVIQKDHELTFEESKGLAKLGSYVYKEGVAGSRYGYPDFYTKCLDEYNNQNNTDETLDVINNITPVGELTIDNGVISGFNSTSWAVLPNNFSPNSASWEINLKFTTNTVGTLQAFVNSSSLAYQPISISLTSSGVVRFIGYSNNTSTVVFEITGTTVLTANTTYYVKASYDATTGYTLKLGTSSDNLTTEGTSSVLTTINSGYNIALGADFGSDGAYSGYNFLGSIDLKECYININGQRWWSGANLIQIKQNANGHKFYDIADKPFIDDIYNSTGEAWYYGIDTENERIFLPRTTRSQYTIDASEVGQYQEAGLPNITGTVKGGELMRELDGYEVSGAFKYTTANSYRPIGESATCGGFTFDASRCSEVYGNSDTVTPSATKKLLYMVVGNTEVETANTEVIDVTTTKNDTVPLFTGQYFDFKPNNLSWLKAGEQQNKASIYEFAYNELVKCLTPANNIYELDVIEESEMVSGVDYSTYWKVNQDQMYFKTPTAIKTKSLSGRVMGDGMSIGWTNGSTNFAMNFGYSANVANTVAFVNASAYGEPVGAANSSVTQLKGSAGVTIDPAKSGIIAEESSAQLYFKVANAVENIEQLNVGEVLETLADKADADLGNVPAAKGILVESYVNDTSWYRVYSDGWCEQGGKIGSNNDTVTVTFLKPFKNNNYIIITQAMNQTGGAVRTVNESNKTSATVKISQSSYAGGNSSPIMWVAFGYIQ